MSLNLYAQVNDRSGQVMEERLAIQNDEQAAKTLTSNGEFDHTEWLEAEQKELTEQRARLMDVVTVEGAAEYE